MIHVDVENLFLDGYICLESHSESEDATTLRMLWTTGHLKGILESGYGEFINYVQTDNLNKLTDSIDICSQWPEPSIFLIVEPRTQNHERIINMRGSTKQLMMVSI